MENTESHLHVCTFFGYDVSTKVVRELISTTVQSKQYIEFIDWWILRHFSSMTKLLQTENILTSDRSTEGNGDGQCRNWLMLGLHPVERKWKVQWKEWTM